MLSNDPVSGLLGSAPGQQSAALRQPVSAMADSASIHSSLPLGLVRSPGCRYEALRSQSLINDTASDQCRARVGSRTRSAKAGSNLSRTSSSEGLGRAKRNSVSVPDSNDCQSVMSNDRRGAVSLSAAADSCASQRMHECHIEQPLVCCDSNLLLCTEHSDSLTSSSECRDLPEDQETERTKSFINKDFAMSEVENSVPTVDTAAVTLLIESVKLDDDDERCHSVLDCSLSQDMTRSAETSLKSPGVRKQVTINTDVQVFDSGQTFECEETFAAKINVQFKTLQVPQNESSKCRKSSTPVKSLEVTNVESIAGYHDSEDAETDEEATGEKKESSDDAEEQNETPVSSSPNGRFLKFDMEIGRGSFKTVYKGLDTETGVQVAWCELPVSAAPTTNAITNIILKKFSPYGLATGVSMLACVTKCMSLTIDQYLCRVTR